MPIGIALQACFEGLTQVFAWPESGLLVVGVGLGALVGILPGLGGSASLAILLPLTLTLPPSQTFALLIGVAAVAATTGDLTSILVGIPGEATAAATVVDGHPMAARGEAARAMGASLFSSLAGSIFGALTLALSIPFALGLARSIGSPELLMLALLGITFLAPVSNASRLNGLIAGGLGVMLATIGLDPMTATARFTFGQLSLWDGIGPIPVALGLFAIPEIVQLANLPRSVLRAPTPPTVRLADGLRDVRRAWRLVLQSSAVGTMVGLVPGIGASVSQWMAYGLAARRSPAGAAFGEGAVEGVIAPSAANNATLGGALVPALALGIPGSLLSALLLTAFIMKGLVPGPTMLMPEAQGGHLALVFTLVWLLVIANVLAVALACASTSLLLQVTRVPAARLVPFLLLLVLIGAFAERRSLADLLLTSGLGALGLALVRFRWPRAPVLMGLVLAPVIENRLFLSIDAYGASWLWRPGVLLIAAAIVAGLVIPVARGSRLSARTDPASSLAGEQVFSVLLIAIMAAAFVAACAYARRPATVPQFVAGGMIVCLLTALATAPREGGEPSVQHTESLGWRTVSAWIPIFLVCIWTLGFVVGAPLALLGYLLLIARERLMFAAAASAATFVFLYVVLGRLLGVPFPPGALLA